MQGFPRHERDGVRLGFLESFERSRQRRLFCVRMGPIFARRGREVIGWCVWIEEKKGDYRQRPVADTAKFAKEDFNEASAHYQALKQRDAFWEATNGFFLEERL